VVEDVMESDSVTDLVAELPWTRETRTQTIDLRYRPYLLRYDDFSELDRDEHDLRFTFRDRLRNADLRVTSRVNFSQRQGDAASLDASELFLNQRADRDIYLANMRYTQDRERRWSWEAVAGGAIRNLTPVQGFESTNPENQTEDRNELYAGGSFSRNLSRTSSLGVEYVFNYYDLQFSGSSNTHVVGVVYTRELSRKSSLELGGGGFYSQGDAVRDPADPTSSDTADGFQGRAVYSRQYRAMQLDLEASHLPSAGGNSRGTATNSLLGLTLQNRGESLWNWRVSPRLARRDPPGSNNARNSAALRVSVERAFSRTRELSLRLDANYIKQNYESTQPDRDIFAAALNLLWYPMAKTALARGR